MKIIICGSISAADEIIDIQQQLEKIGHTVEIPEGVKHQELRSKEDALPEERADIKIKHDLIRGYYEKMKLYDAVLIVNPDKKDVKRYIGGNTFIEMAFAHILNKKLYCLYSLPDISYKSELIAMKPFILGGDLTKIS